MKVLSRNDQKRPLDRADLAALLKIAKSSELEMARELLAKMMARGTHRGRTLTRELDRAAAEFLDDTANEF
jgi:hypothetical protein